MARLLVVDDSRMTRRLIASALTDAGHEVVQAINGSEGLDHFKSNHFDAVFSDLLMPVMDGFELTTAIRELNSSIPIVVATADIQETSRERCEAIGVSKMLNKPFKANQIVSALESVLDSVGGKSL